MSRRNFRTSSSAFENFEGKKTSRSTFITLLKEFFGELSEEAQQKLLLMIYEKNSWKIH